MVRLGAPWGGVSVKAALQLRQENASYCAFCSSDLLLTLKARNAGNPELAAADWALAGCCPAAAAICVCMSAQHMVAAKTPKAAATIISHLLREHDTGKSYDGFDLDQIRQAENLNPSVDEQTCNAHSTWRASREVFGN
jgi:hypothetical protein